MSITTREYSECLCYIRPYAGYLNRPHLNTLHQWKTPFLRVIMLVCKGPLRQIHLGRGGFLFRFIFYLVGLPAALWFSIFKKKKTQMVAKRHIIPSYLVPYIPCEFNMSKHSQGILIFGHIISETFFAHCWQKIVDWRTNNWYVLGPSPIFSDRRTLNFLKVKYNPTNKKMWPYPRIKIFQLEASCRIQFPQKQSRIFAE